MPAVFRRRRPDRSAGAPVLGALAMLALGVVGCQDRQPTLPVAPDEVLEVRHPNEGRLIRLPPGFHIDKIAEGLSFTTEMAFDDRGRLYVNEAGGGFEPVQFRAPRILRITGTRQVEEVINLTGHVVPPVVGLAWHDGWLYFTHRDLDDTGALSRVRDTGGMPEKLLTGFVDAQAEHFMNGIEIRDGWVYFGVGQAGNATVLGPDVGFAIMKNPGVRPTPCRDLVMRGHNFLGPNILTPDPNDMVLTGPYARFGEIRRRGEVVQGVQKCGGAVHRFDPNNPEGTLEMVADGIRQPIGLAFNQMGELFVPENGYDVRGLRPVQDEFDVTLRINPNQPGRWYGFPDFSAAREPLTLPKFGVPDEQQAPVFLVREDGTREELGKFLDFIIDHSASGLSAPSRNWVAGLHPVHSSPAGVDVAPASWGPAAGWVAVAEWGDLTPPTNPLLPNLRAGIRIVAFNPDQPQMGVIPFVQNRRRGTASELGRPGQGLERPYDVLFGPNVDHPELRDAVDVMYISDYGRVEIDMSKAPPYRYIPDTGVIWRVTRRTPWPAAAAASALSQ
ncbi:MAG: sugar dehydrogenase [Gemmatimonadota bacterium]|nr:sugar dehydrogenase [Gemmatimonadota bacterium]